MIKRKMYMYFEEKKKLALLIVENLWLIREKVHYITYNV